MSTKQNCEPTSSEQLITLGWREWLALPDLGIGKIKAKIDTGARTSALHAYFVEPYKKDGQKRVKFGIHPNQDDTETEIICDAPVLEERKITDSGGHIESRFVIETTVLIGNIPRVIELTLTNRDTMKFRMLLGRTAINNVCNVNPAASYLLSEVSV
jgi:hypothetical protein